MLTTDRLVISLSSPPLLAVFPEIYNLVVHPGNAVPDDKTSYECVCKPDQAPYKRYPVPDEELTEERKMWPNNVPSPENQPICCNKHCKSGDNPGDNALNRCVESQKPGQYHLLKSVLVFGHEVLWLGSGLGLG